MDLASLLAQGVQPVKVADPMQSIAQVLQTATLARQGQAQQYALAKQQREDAAANSYNSALATLDYSDPNSVRTALQNADPNARPLILKGYLDYQKNQAGVAKDTAEAQKNSATARKTTGDQISGIAGFYAGQPITPDTVARAQATATKFGLDPKIFAVPDGVDPQQYYTSLAQGGIDAAKQAELAGQGATRAETARHNSTTETETAARDAATRAYQTGELDVNRRRALAALAQADPWGILGLNTGQPSQAPQGAAPQPSGVQTDATVAPNAPPPGAGTVQGPNGPVVTPDAQAQRNAASLAILQQERAAQAQAGQVDPALDAEIARAQKTAASGNPFAGGLASNPQAPSLGGGQPSYDVRGAMQSGAHGAEFLAQLPPNLAAQVQAYAEGRRSFPGGAAMRSQAVQQMMDMVGQYDPTFDQVNYNARNKTRMSFAGGADSNTTASLNQLAGHIGRLEQSIAGLDNYGGPFANAYNTVANAAAAQLDPSFKGKLNTYNTDLQGVVSEAERLFRGSGGSEGDLNRWRSTFNSSDSPQAQMAAVKELAHLIGSRIDAQVTKYQEGMGTTARALPALTPAAADTYRNLGIDVSAGVSSPPTRGAPSQPAGKTLTPQARDDLVAQAMDAISKGAPRDKVLARLQQMGVTDARI